LKVAALLAALPWLSVALAAEAPRFEVYGFVMLDMGYETGRSDPDWFDVLRPTKLPSSDDPGELTSAGKPFGADHNFYASVRQTRFGVKADFPAGDAAIKTIFEFELFGVGVDAGQTTIRLRHAYGEYKKWGAGQYWSPFMDIDVFPNSIEYWGPSGMAFFRNVQVRYMPLQGRNAVTIALERPGASGDPGIFVGAPQVGDVDPRFPLPDLSAHWRCTRDWGHLQVAGILRAMEWDDLGTQPGDASGDATGWGVNVSSNVKFDEDTLRMSVVYGEGIANYMNDATFDVGATGDADIGEALPLLGVVLFYDHTWDNTWTSSVGYSLIDFDNSAAQADEAFQRGQYALVNLLNHSVKNLMWGGEIQWGERKNNADGFTVDDVRFQFSAKYNFGHVWGGQP
jgi:hypothetical protein